MTERELTFIDLFCGIGSFHHSLSKLGMKCIFACDINEDCRNTYERNYGMRPAGDICKINIADVPSFDILCAGFPCQPFSVAGHHKGFEDSRGGMFFEVMRFVDHHIPSCIILENVAGLENHDGGKTLKRMIDMLEEKKYNVIKRVLVCSDYGIPQMRKRLFIIATNFKVTESVLNFEQIPSKSLTHYLNDGRSDNEKVIMKEKEIAYTIRCGGRYSNINDGHNWDGYYATKFSDPINEFVYRLSIKDCLKLQGFDENKFVLVGSDKAKWKMVGNTIPTNLTFLVGNSVRNLLLLSSQISKRGLINEEDNDNKIITKKIKIKDKD